jgi:maltodextrin utilization protein YvdJ
MLGNTDLDISTDLNVLSPLQKNKWFLKCRLSVCLSVCLSVVLFVCISLYVVLYIDVVLDITKMVDGIVITFGN